MTDNNGAGHLCGIKICYVLTVPFAVKVFIRDHILRLVSEGCLITVCVNTDELAVPFDFPPSVRIVPMPIERGINPVSDLINLWRLARFFHRERFNIVHSLMPKSGLIAMLAACLVSVPNRVHTFTGQVWVTERGAKKILLKNLDRLMAACATRVLADSQSQADFLIAQGVVRSKPVSVLASGSICGVDIERFKPDGAHRLRIRHQLGMVAGEVLLLFVGRLKKEKGVIDLTSAFLRLRKADCPVRLLFVGPDEEGLAKTWQDIPGLHHINYTPQVEEYFAAADLLCLPSYREGFGSVLIEAGASGLPVVASRIYGITDAVEENVTGLLHEPGDIHDLMRVVNLLVASPKLRQELAAHGIRRARDHFRKELVTDALLSVYCKLSQEKSCGNRD